jgi:hypothetical protein
MRRVLVANPGKKQFDPRSPGDTVVFAELKLGRHAQSKRSRDSRPQM